MAMAMIEDGVNRELQDYSQLPTTYSCGQPLRNYSGFWYSDNILPGVISALDDDGRHLFLPRPDDTLLASFPKSGTTWLKALAFSILNRFRHPPADHAHPLRSSLHAQDAVLFLEGRLSLGHASDLQSLPSPRVLATHLPFQLLPQPLASNDTSKIVYMCRNPKDAFVSGWHFVNAVPTPDIATSTLDVEFGKWCEGKTPFGPMWDHWLGYWRESLRRPEKVLFLKYEDVIEDGAGNVRRMAEFLGCPFSKEEEEGGVVEEIVRLCSFESLREAPASKEGRRGWKGVVEFENSSYYRKGRVGDWVKSLSDEMGRRMDEIVDEKLQKSGLSFNNYTL